jgi:dTDP-4-dehydrorhamnose reductase
MKVLILGAKGVVGTAVENVCKEQKLENISLDIEDLDIGNKKNLVEIMDYHRPNVVVNAAVIMGFNSCEENPEKAFGVNALSVLNMAKWCQKNNSTLIQTSTNAVFSGNKNDFYFESDSPNPSTVYAISKYAGELCAQNGTNSHYIIRLPKLFGPRRNEGSDFTEKIIKKMRSEKELKIAEDRFDPFTYSVHAARKMLELVHQPAPFGIYHITNQGSTSYYDFVCELGKILNYSGNILRCKDSDLKSPYPNPLRIELGSLKISDMPSWKEALAEYINTENIRL